MPRIYSNKASKSNKALSPKTIQNIQILTLAIAGFIFNTTEFIPVGLLSAIAGDFHVSPAQVGWIMTIYAWVVAGCSLPLITVTRRLERKRLMTAVFVVFIASHILSLSAWSLSVLLISRIGVALSHAVFWSMTANMAMRLVPIERKPFALSMIATGTSLAMIIGVPLGRVIGEYFGWRATFACIAVLAGLILIILLRLLPQLPSTFKGSLREIATLFKNPQLLLIYLFTLLMFTCHFTTYSYIEPYLLQIGHYSADSVTLWLLLFGVAAISGSLSFSRLCRYVTFRTRFTALSCLFVASIFCLPWCISSAVLLFALIMLWGATRIMQVLSLQSLVLNGKGGDFVMAVFSSIVNIGIGTGALLGAQVIKQSHLINLTYISAVLGIAALGVMLKILSHSQLATE